MSGNKRKLSAEALELVRTTRHCLACDASIGLALDAAERRGAGKAVAKAVSLFYVSQKDGEQLLQHLLNEKGAEPESPAPGGECMNTPDEPPS